MIKIDENQDKDVTYENEPDSQRQLFPNIPLTVDVSPLQDAIDALDDRMDDAESDIDSIMTTLQTFDGQPGVAETVSDMTDTNKIYIYVGSETGYTSGDWYYYDGTAWVSGGEYAANPVQIDDTLTQSGEAADAKVTGDEIAQIKSDFVSKKGENQVKYTNIDSSNIIETDITDGITENSYWYATGSGTIASGGAKSGMDKAAIDVESMTGKIVFGYDSNTDYGTGSFVIGISSSKTSPYTRIAYYSKTTILTTDYFTVSGNVVEFDLDAFKRDQPTSVMIFINIPHSVWTLKHKSNATKKALAWLKGVVTAIVVAPDGSGDYTTIAEAVSAASDGDTIYIRNGEYKETVIVNKYLHLVGQSKQGTILYNDVGDYDHAPLAITQGSVCNMTIKSIAPDDTSGLTDYAFAIHLDKNFASLAKYQKCEIYNCDIYSEVNDAIGAGTNYASEYDIHDCFLHVAHNPVKTGACGFKCHNGQNQTTGKVTLRNNVIITEDANGTSTYDILYHNGGITNIQPIDILQVGNVLKYYRNNITSIFVPNSRNWGNSVAVMNELS